MSQTVNNSLNNTILNTSNTINSNNNIINNSNNNTITTNSNNNSIINEKNSQNNNITNNNIISNTIKDNSNNIKNNTIETSKINPTQDNINISKILMNENLCRTWSTGALCPNIITPITGNNTKLPAKFYEMYRKSFINVDAINELVKNKEIKKDNDDEDILKIDEDQSSNNEKRVFDFVEVDDNYSFEIISRNELSTKEQRMYEKLQKMLLRVQQRKNILITRKSRFNENIEKIGILNYKNRKCEIN